MSTTPPIKPPRGIKTSKETSGLLISVIRALSASETNEQREVEKAKLEKEFKKSDQKLDDLVKVHDKNLTEVMKIFSNLSERVTSAREKIHTVKENLNACKQLLRCRREELMKLWLEGVEHKHVLKLLNDIEQLKEVPSKFSNYLNKKLYLHATQLLVSALTMGDGSLEGVEALRELKMELEMKKQQLKQKLLEELNRHLYVETTREVLLKRQGSGRDFQRGNETRGSRGAKIKRALLEVNYSNNQSTRSINHHTNNEDITIIIEDEDSLNPEENSEHFIAIIIECLALLNCIPEAIEVIKLQMQTELLNIIARTSGQIIKTNAEKFLISTKIIPEVSQIRMLSENNVENKTLLLELLQTIFDQFRLIAGVHSNALKSFSNVCKKYNLDVRLYEMPDVWSQIQTVLQLLLTEYLDIQNMVDKPFQSAAFNEATVDINTYFAKKKPQRSKNSTLFKFDFTSHSKTLNSYLKDQKFNNLNLADNNHVPKNIGKLVCQPDPKNITFIFCPMMQFIEEIERALDFKPGCSCTLNSFITDYVKEVFLGRHHIMVATTIDAATKSSDAWQAVTPPELMKELGIPRPLLQSTVKVEHCLAELRSLMISLPLQGEHFCTLALNVLHNYRETCQGAYRNIIQFGDEDKKICSATWLKDDDISRFIKSLPNWDNMKSEFTGKRGKGRWSMQRQETQDEESPEDVRQRNLREAEILASNLGEGGINSNEILSDVGQLRSLALLQESVEWFALSIRSLILELQRARNNGKDEQVLLPRVDDSFLELFEQVAGEFEELGNNCILLLHLEVRVQCFYYLLPHGEYSHLCDGVKDPQEADPRVEELSRVLQNIDEALQSTLHPKKTKYIFEGLGHLITKILITSAQYIEKIEKSSIQRMCRNVFTLQQTLTNITMARELALDYARQYFELFYETPEDILNSILENGAKFSELEYINAFQLIARSHQQHASISKYLEKLSEILGEVGVTV